jgi:sec-independent protein translocase protein TatB
VFDFFSPSHLLLVAIAVIVFVGPKDLPRFMRGVGRWTAKMKSIAAEFTSSLEEMGRHEELRELRNELDALRASRVEEAPAARPPANDDHAAVEHNDIVAAEMAAQ